MSYFAIQERSYLAFTWKTKGSLVMNSTFCLHQMGTEIQRQKYRGAVCWLDVSSKKKGQSYTLKYQQHNIVSFIARKTFISISTQHCHEQKPLFTIFGRAVLVL